MSNGIYKQGLQRLVNNINSNNLNSATRIFEGEIHRSLTNRLRIAEFVNKNPDVNNTDLNDPIFILGLPRSGTTALQAMFACIDVCRVLKLWELHYPTAFGEGEQAIKRAKTNHDTTLFFKTSLNQSKNIFTRSTLNFLMNVSDCYLIHLHH